jgi:hypothetical protein
MSEQDEPETVAGVTDPAAPAEPVVEEPKPVPSEFMTKADFKAAMDEWKAEQAADAAKTSEPKKTAPAPEKKVKPAPKVEAAPEQEDEPSYGSRTWFNRKKKAST